MSESYDWADVVWMEWCERGYFGPDLDGILKRLGKTREELDAEVLRIDREYSMHVGIEMELAAGESHPFVIWLDC